MDDRVEVQQGREYTRTLILIHQLTKDWSLIQTQKCEGPENFSLMENYSYTSIDQRLEFNVKDQNFHIKKLETIKALQKYVVSNS